MSKANTIKELIFQGEGERLDFKQSIHSSLKIAKIVSAFANTKGGILLVGIKDNGHPAKINPEEEQHVLEMAADFYCKPSVVLKFTQENYLGYSILVAEIPCSTDKPHLAKTEDGKWWAYIRVHDQCLLASKVMLEVMRSSSNDEPVAINFGTAEKILLQYLEAHQRITLKEFCKKANIARWRAQKILVNLVKMGLVKVISTEKTDFYSL